MIELQTSRLIMRTNLQFDKGHIVFPPPKKHASILDIQPNVPEDGGFIFYTPKYDQVCHIAIRTDRKPLEISYGTEPQYRRNGYMQEALAFVLKLFSENDLSDGVYALICDNPESEHILKKNGFIFAEQNESGGYWLIHK